MSGQAVHPLLPQAKPDEGARQDFVQSLRRHLVGGMAPSHRAVYNQRALPAFRKARGHTPRTRHDARAAMLRDPLHQAWSSLMRTTQEMMWDAVDEAVMQDLPRLGKLAPRSMKNLTLRPALDKPRYAAALDTHCMPGSYTGEVAAGDLRTGALYDRAVHIYMLGVLGPYNQKAGEIVISYIRRRFPDLKPKAILDVGCGVGHATLPYVDAFPGAKITGVDVAAPMLRYAHARASALGHDINFVQDNAEKLSFPDNSFDLVVSHILIHETSRSGLTNTLRESYRVLKPGGVAIHVDGAGFAGKDLLEQYLADWDTYFNAEPFVGTLHDLDLKALTRKAGIPASAAIVETTADGYARHTGGSLKVVGGRKPR